MFKRSAPSPTDTLKLAWFRQPWIGWLQMVVMAWGCLFPGNLAQSYQHDSNGDGIPEQHSDPADPNDSWWTLDSDGDFMTNAEEVVFGSDPYVIDSDLDGLTDRDERDYGLTNPWLWDSDGDGYSDHDEYYQCYTVDYHLLTSSSWSYTSFYDADGDGHHNHEDSDPLNSSLWDDWNRNGVSDPVDGTSDSDSDGVSDLSDSHPNDALLWNDWNSDGVNDDLGSSNDSDGDGYDDYNDSHPSDPTKWADWDTDGDGVLNADDSHWDNNLLWCDWNNNGFNDNAENTFSDYDGDYYENSVDSHPDNPNLWSDWNGNGFNDGSEMWTDVDGDQAVDGADSHPWDPNFWDDWNYNGTNDHVEQYNRDDDGDTHINGVDSHPSDPERWSDFNNNGLNDNDEPDSDGDGIVDFGDSWSLDPWNGYDTDGDGLTDYQERGHGDYTGLGTDYQRVDTDGDLLSDGQEVLIFHTNPLKPKTNDDQPHSDFYMVVQDDADNDGLPDFVEDHYLGLGFGLDKNNPNDALGDLDGDGLSNLQAYRSGLSLVAGMGTYDQDGDSMTDAEEFAYPGILDSTVFADAVLDYDGDGLMNYEEIRQGTNPTNIHSLNSAEHQPDISLPNDVDLWMWRTNVRVMIYDWDASNIPATIITTPYDFFDEGDNDANGVPDGYYRWLSHPNHSSVPPEIFDDDIDNDGLPNLWEHRYKLSPRSSVDAGPTIGLVVQLPIPSDNWQDYVDEDAYNAANPDPEYPGNRYSYYRSDWHEAAKMAYEHARLQDPDLDGLSNLREFQLGTNPRVQDTDGDGVLDGREVPVKPEEEEDDPPTPPVDTDGDGLSDVLEAVIGTNHQQQDSDGDGFNDLEEFLANTLANDPLSYPGEPPGGDGDGSGGVVVGSGPHPVNSNPATVLPPGSVLDKGILEVPVSGPTEPQPIFEYFSVTEGSAVATGSGTNGGSSAHFWHFSWDAYTYTHYEPPTPCPCQIAPDQNLCGTASQVETSEPVYGMVPVYETQAVPRIGPDGIPETDGEGNLLYDYVQVQTGTEPGIVGYTTRLTWDHSNCTCQGQPGMSMEVEVPAGQSKTSGHMIVRFEENVALTKVFQYKRSDGGSYEVIVPAGSKEGRGPTIDPPNNSSVKVELVGRGSATPFTLNGHDAAGPRYRKIGLNGVPLSDSKPQSQDESGENAEETYIDALSRELRHSSSDVYATVDSSLLPLAVRRHASQDVWNVRSGLRPNERGDRPFGAGWASNLTASIVVSDNERRAVVTDEQGGSQTFVRLPNSSIWMNTRQEKEDVKTSQNTLAFMPGSGTPSFVYKKKFGTTCVFQLCPLIQTLASNRETNMGSSANYLYYRLVSVSDRLGNQLEYTYPPGQTIIPRTITDPDRPGHTISITQNDGVVTRVRGPGGNTTYYTYDTVGSGVKVLTAVTRDGSTVRYEYDLDSEPDDNIYSGGPRPPHQHLALKSITDENGNRYAFGYEFNQNFFYTHYDDNGVTALYRQTGLPRLVTRVTIPGNKFTAFGGDRHLVVRGTSEPEVTAYATTLVSGPAGSTSYSFNEPNIFVPLQADPGDQDLLSRHVTISYQRMNVTRAGNTETFTFDKDSGMALSSARDISGNITRFTYAGGYDDPVEEINAMGGVKRFTYAGESRVMKSFTDESGVKTEYQIEPTTGLRLRERVMDGNDLLRETEFEYDDSKFKGFMTRKIIRKPSGVGSAVDDHVTEYERDPLGRVKQEKVQSGSGELVTTYYHDYNGNKRFVEDPEGNVTEFSYDSGNRLRRVTNADGTQRSLVYDAHGNLVVEVNENGVYTLHSYDQHNRRVKTALDLDGNKRADGRNTDIVKEWKYNSMNQVVEETDPRGTRTVHGYDAIGRRISTEIGGTLRTTFAYGGNSGGSLFDSSGFKPTVIRAPRNITTEIVYDKMYRPVRQATTEAGATTTAYDAAGRPTEVRDALGRTTKMKYDGLGQLIEKTAPDNTKDKTWYTQHGQPWKVLDELNRATTTKYDGAGRPIEVTNAEGETVYTRYDDASNPDRITDARGNATHTEYDRRNRPVEVTGSAVMDHLTGQLEHPVSMTKYDRVGNVLEVTDPLGNVVKKQYDRAGRVVKTTDPLNHSVEQTYDKGGLVLSVTDARNKVTLNQYDHLGRLTQTQDPNGGVTYFGYDESGNRVSVKDPTSHTTRFKYDRQNRLLSETHPNGDSVTYTYNVMQKLGRQDAAGTTTYQYDGRDRVIRVAPPAQAVRTYQYDVAGQLKTVSEAGNAVADVSYQYGSVGRLISETSRGVTTTHEYDENGNRTKSTYGTGRVETRSYDPLNRLEELSEGGRVTKWHYDLASRAVALTLPNGQQQDNHYDDAGRLTDRHLFGPETGPGANGLLLATFEWDHDAAGNVVEQKELWPGDVTRAATVRTTTMEYDDGGRLLHETVAQATQPTIKTSYEYDANNNRTKKSEYNNDALTRSTIFVYNSASQLTSWNQQNGAGQSSRRANLEYDGRGNRTKQTIIVRASSVTQYAWDGENRLKSVTLPGGEVHQYGYDYRCRRITRGEGNAITAIAYSGGLSVAEYPTSSWYGAISAPSSPVVQYQRGPDMGGGVGGLLYTLRNGQAKFNLSNGRGDIVAQSDGTGALMWNASYEAYGKRTVEKGSNADRQRANSKEEDPTGLLNEGFRYRDIESGVWMSRDPAGFVDGPNLYAYVLQNPWTAFDPDGLETKFLVGNTVWHFGGSSGMATSRVFESERASTPTLGQFLKDRLFNTSVAAERFNNLKSDPIGFARGVVESQTGPLGPETSASLSGRSVGENAADIAAIASISTGRMKGAGTSGPGPALATANGMVISTPTTGAGIIVPPLMLMNQGEGSTNLEGSAQDTSKAEKGEKNSRLARLKAMRMEGIPTSQQPSSQSKNESGYEYQYVVPKSGGGTEIKSVQQQTMDRSHPGQGHWEAGTAKVDPITGALRMSKYGRPRLENQKSKVNYDN